MSIQSTSKAHEQLCEMIFKGELISLFEAPAFCQNVSSIFRLFKLKPFTVLFSVDFVILVKGFILKQ